MVTKTEKDFSDFKPVAYDNPFVIGESFKKLAPMYVDYHKTEGIPDGFRPGAGDRSMWNTVVSQWFFRGISGESQFIPKEGIDITLAMKHIKGILGSYEPDHASKEQIAAYLMSLWFEDFIPSDEEPEHFRKELAYRRENWKNG
jgi:hypothetical protein